MPRTMLTTIEVVLDLDNRLVLAPGVNSSVADSIERTKTVELICPNGSSVIANVLGIELPTPNPKKICPIALSKKLDKDNIPIGTQVWTIDDHK